MNKEIKKYLSAVKRRLNLPRDIRNRLLSDLETTINARLEQGEDWSAIRETLGSPTQVAGEYTEQMKEFAYRKSPWRFLPLAIAILCGVRFVYEWVMVLATKLFVAAMSLDGSASSVGIIGGADGPTAVFITSGAPIWKISRVALVFVLALLCYLRLRKCKNKENSL